VVLCASVAHGTGDRAPRILSIHLSPAGATRTATVTAAVTTRDPDGNRVRVGYRWLRNGTAIAGATARTIDLAHHTIHKGDRLAVRVTASDGVRSVTATSSALFIHDSPPVASSLTIDQQAPTMADTLTASLVASDADGDVLSEQRTWSWTCPDGPSGSVQASSLDLGANGVAHGCVVALSEDVSDGQLATAVSATSVTVVNRPPVIHSVGIDDTSPATNDVVHAVVDAVDPDGDPLTLSYQWYRNGTPIAGGTTAGLDLSQADHGDRGDQISVAVTADDGTAHSSADSNSVTVANTAPLVDPPQFSTATPIAGSQISLGPVSTSDADGDPVSTTVDWFLNGVSAGSGTTIQVPPSALRGDTRRAVVTANDGTESNSVPVEEQVADAPPVIGSVTVDAASPRTNDTVHAVVEASDPDGDPVTLAYQWYLNGTAITGATGSSLDLSQAGHGDRGDRISVTVTADDGTVQTMATSDAVTVADTAPTLAHAVIHYDPQTATATVSTAATDADGDVLRTSVRWTINGEDAGSSTPLDVQAAGAHLRDVLGARVWVTDAASADSNWVTAPEVTISSGVGAAPAMNAWRPLTHVADSDVYAILPVASQQGEMYMAESFGVHRSTDGGMSWSDRNGPCVSTDAAAVDPADPSIVYAGCSGSGAYRSDDGGGTWQHLPDPGGGTGTSVAALAVDPAAPDTLFAAGWYGAGDVFRSTDGGQTWQTVDAQGELGLSIAIDPGDSEHVVVGTQHGVIVSTDGGDTWSGPIGTGSMEVTFDPANPAKIWAIRSNVAGPSVLQSTDGGLTWTTLVGSPAHLSLLAASQGTVDVAGSSGTVFHSTDDGVSWTSASIVGGSGHQLTALAADATDPSQLYAGYEDGAVWTLDLASDAPSGSLTDYIPVRIDGVTNITQTSATLDATIAPMFDTDHGWICWGWSPDPASDWCSLDPFQGSMSPQHVSFPAIALEPGATYYVTVRPALAGDFGYSGATQTTTFTTPPASGGSVATDTAPTLNGVTIDDGQPTTTSVLHAQVDATDADNDPLVYSYQWLKNGVPIPGATQSSLDLSQPGTGDRGDAISVEASVSDGIDQAEATSGTVTVVNTAPTLGSATLVYDAAAGTATVTTDATDADGDPLTASVVWTLNGQDVSTNATLDLAAAGAGFGDTVEARVQISDGSASTSWVSATPVSITTGPPRLLTSDVMPWGLMKGTYSIGNTVAIYTDNSTSADGALALPGLISGTCSATVGANEYASEISGAEKACALSIGQVMPVKTGQNSGPTGQGLNTRIATYSAVDQIATSMPGGYVITTPSSPQLVRIPVVVNAADGSSIWPSGSGNLQFVGYTWAIITGYTSLGKVVNVTIIGSTL
jgi:large repetitive protein